VFAIGTSNNQTITSNTVYGRFTFLENKKTPVDTIKRKSRDKTEVKNVISMSCFF
jgi:hypothetical protein